MIELHVERMSCNHCISKVTRAVKGVDAGATVAVDLKGRKVRVESAADAEEIGAAVADAGYAVRDDSAA
jgi:copper chaperone CopZ